MNDETQTILSKSFKISLDEAAHLILSFLREPRLGDLAFSAAIGGTVLKSAIKKEAGMIYNGSMAWYCRNLVGPGYLPELFLAFEDGSYEVAKVPRAPTSEKLIYTGRPFTYKREITMSEVLDMLKHDEIPLVADLEINKADVMNCINRLPSDDFGDPYNKFPCSFFENRGVVNRDMDDFLSNGALKAVRYYFGYDTSYSHTKSNRIRVIFVGVDQDGRNIVGADNQTMVTSRLVQNSWPPPPPPYTEQID
ncbi:hypothetical protein [Algoriphagus sp. A40]|uniref:hypothetical protein n=1 Tax=Algoriphagus sp. A40 TaxID=1945863 RepID=UPI000986F4FB|nr:hypothetical protein [Algoriphagus sp. A40]OOG73812.1 hypothetical protein B0E43_13300 [Algoriphagus sp. A40]